MQLEVQTWSVVRVRVSNPKPISNGWRDPQDLPIWDQFYISNVSHAFGIRCLHSACGISCFHLMMYANKSYLLLVFLRSCHFLDYYAIFKI